MTNSTAIGYNAKVTASNQVVIGNANVTETIVNGAITGAASISCAPTIFVHTDEESLIPEPEKAGDILYKTYNNTAWVAVKSEYLYGYYWVRANEDE